MKKYFRKLRKGEKGFTLVELLVVVAILGVLAAVAVPNVGSFINKGKVEALETELHNIQTGVMAMLAESKDGTLTGTDGFGPTTDMGVITADAKEGGTLLLTKYLTGLGGSEGTLAKAAVAQDKGYTFADDGTVTVSEYFTPTTPPAE